MFELLGNILLGLLILLVIGAALSPFESLGWWAGWFGEEQAPAVPGQPGAVSAAVTPSPHKHFLVYLSGIGAMEGTAVPQEEIDWGLVAMRRIPQTTFVPDVYPYSVTNTGLLADRWLSRIWRYLERRRQKNAFDLLQVFINIRNMFQVAISADRRYGPIYNLGVANEIVRALQLRGYQLGSGVPVTLLGASGGGQVAVGAATYLKPKLNAPIRVISLGGVVSDDVGVWAVDKLYHLYGTTDPIHGLGAFLYAGRWPIFPQSDWNRALAQGKIVFVELGPMAHNGAQNYYSWTALTPQGQSHAVAVIDAISTLLVQDGVVEAEAVRAAAAATDAEARAISDARRAEADAANAARRRQRGEAV